MQRGNTSSSLFAEDDYEEVDYEELARSYATPEYFALLETTKGGKGPLTPAVVRVVMKMLGKQASPRAASAHRSFSWCFAVDGRGALGDGGRRDALRRLRGAEHCMMRRHKPPSLTLRTRLQRLMKGGGASCNGSGTMPPEEAPHISCTPSRYQTALHCARASTHQCCMGVGDGNGTCMHAGAPGAACMYVSILPTRCARSCAGCWEGWRR